MRKIDLVLICFVCMTLTSHANARNRFDLDDSFLQTDDATKKEVERIQKMQPSKNSSLNQESLRDARSAAEEYSKYSDQITELEKISVDSAKEKIKKAKEGLLSAIKESKPALIAENLLTIKRQIEKLNYNYNSFFQEEASLPESEETTMRSVFSFLRSDPEKICQNYTDTEKVKEMLNQLDSAVNIAVKQLASQILNIKERSPRAKILSEAWGKYRDLLLKSIEDQSAPATKVADQLGIIIGVFCAFGIFMFLAVRVFPDSVQIELIASGQVIQFATVMVLLIVVCVLGMSRFLTENTLGTLLGGIGGYVLSQGVGRAVSRAATRNSQSSQQQAGTNG